MPQKRNLAEEDLLRAVKEYLDERYSFADLGRKYGISKDRLRQYVLSYKAKGVSALYRQAHNNSYSTETKKKAVEEYLAGHGSLKDIVAKYGLNTDSTLRRWINVYNSGRGFRHKMSGGSRMKETRPTTLEERIQIAKDCIANGGNYGETALKYKVSYQQVYQWTKKFKEMGAVGLEDRRGKRKKDQTPRTELEKAQIEIERLKHELYMTRMERDLLKKLDEIERREAYRK